MVQNFGPDTHNHSQTQDSNGSSEEMIAVVGMSCLLPGGIANYDDFWSALLSGSDQRSEVPFTRWNGSVYHNSESTNETKTSTENAAKSMIGMTNTNHGYFLPDHYLTDIDASLFYLSPAEVPAIDPQQRLLLKLSLNCFDDAGISTSKLKGSKTGVYIGVMNLDYTNHQSNRYLNINEFSSLGLSNSILSNRLSYTFDLRGPSMTVDTACSSSAVCIYHAMNSLRNMETDMCLVGGINVMLSPRVFVTLTQMNLLSSDGRCKAFDEKGDGYARGEGGGILLLKRLKDAQRDGDRIHGLLVGSAINQDGRSSIPITSPNIQSQIDLYRYIYEKCRLDPSDVQYVEAHGTGTAKGDAVEINSIQSFFLNEKKNSSQLLRIGSVKTNIGHLESGAGVIGVMKSLLCLKHAKFVPSLHFHNYPTSFVNVHPNLKVQTSVEEWPSFHDKARFCGVNSFGYGGTNAHVIVMEYPKKNAEHSLTNGHGNRIFPFIFPISTKHKQSLSKLMEDHLSYLVDNENSEDLEDYCYTLACRKFQFNYRAAIIAKDHQELIEQLKSPSTNLIYTNTKFVFSENTKLTFVFGGQGSQCIGMGLDLMCFPTFVKHMSLIDQWTRTNHNWSLLEALREYSSEIEDANRWNLVQSTVAIFAIETSTAVLLNQYGIDPSILIGHSAGQFAALYSSRLFDLHTLLSILWKLCSISMDKSISQSQIVQIQSSVEDFQLLLQNLKKEDNSLRIEIACINSPQSITVAGPFHQIEMIKKHISVNEFSPYSIPFHTSLMNIIQTKVIHQLEDLFKNKEKKSSMDSLFFPSSMTNEIVTIIDTNGFAYQLDNVEQIRMKKDLPFFQIEYWWNIIRSQINFLNQIETATKALTQENRSGVILLDLSPQPVLSTASLLSFEYLTKDQDFPFRVLSFNSSSKENILIKFVNILSELYVNGYSNEKIWSRFYPKGKISESRLPSIRYENHSYWSESLESLRSRMLSLYDKQLTNLLNIFSPINDTQITHRDHFLICLYEGFIQISKWKMIQEHVFEHSMLLPATFHLEIFFAIGNVLLPNINYQIKNIQLKEAFWMDQSDFYYMKIEVKPKSLLSFEINVLGSMITKDSFLSKTKTHSLTLYSTAILEYNSINSPIRQRQLDEHFIQSSNKFDSKQFYENFREKGFNYGPSFSLVENVYSQPKNGQALIQIKLPQSIKEEIEENNYYLHPGIVDGSIQGTAYVIDTIINSVSLPIGCQSIHLYQSLNNINDDYLWAEIFSKPTDQQGLELSDIYLYSNNGHHIASFIHFTSKDLSRKNTFDDEKIIKSMTDTSSYIYTEFIEVDRTEVKEKAEMFFVVISNDKFDDQCRNDINLSRIEFDCSMSSHELSSDLQSYNRSIDIIAIVPDMIEQTDAKDPQSIFDNLLIISEWLLKVFQAVSELQSKTTNSQIVSTFQIVTRCSSTEVLSSIIYGCIPGYYRVWLHEKPNTKCRLIEIDIPSTVKISKILLKDIFQEFYLTDVTKACHVKLNPLKNKRFVCNYSFTNLKVIDMSIQLFSSEKIYVLFGGCTTTGISIINWMIQLGAKHIICASRTGFNKRLEEKEIFDILQKKLNNEGIKIEVRLLDITSSNHLENLFKSHSNIGGIMNMCMELKDSLIEDHTSQQIQSGCAPKVLGSFLIHNILQKLNYQLEFFIMFSSTTSMFGNEGQFTYAGANSFMDYLALNNSSSTPYFSISLPAIGDVGYLSNNSRVRQFVEKNGWETVPMKEICHILQSIIHQLKINRYELIANIGILRVNPIRFIQSNSFVEYFSVWKNILLYWQNILPNLWKIIHPNENDQSDVNSPQAISNTVAQLAATISGLSKDEQIPFEIRLSDLGFHSMAAMEFKSNISKLFRIDLPMSFLLGPNTTIQQIQKKVIQMTQPSTHTQSSLNESQNISSNQLSIDQDFSLEIPLIIPFQSSSFQSLYQSIKQIIDHLNNIDPFIFSFTFVNQIQQWIHQIEHSSDYLFQTSILIFQLDKNHVIKQFEKTLSSITKDSSLIKQSTIIYLFPGQGQQYSNMAIGLYQFNRSFRKSFDSLSQIIHSNQWLPTPKQIPFKHFHLKYLIFPFTSPIQIDSNIINLILSQTEYSQPSTFILSYCIAQYLNEIGLKPSFAFGHSVGEYVCACLAGVFNVVDALQFICHRAILMSQCSPGKMIVLNKNLSDTKYLLQQFQINEINIEISASNSDDQTVLGGSFIHMNSFEKYLKENEIMSKQLSTSHAFHTSAMINAANQFTSYLSKYSHLFNSPQIPYLSNLTGLFITNEQAKDIHYYGQHMSQTVLAHQNILHLIQTIENIQSSIIFIECGPGQILTNLFKRQLIKHKQENLNNIQLFHSCNTLHKFNLSQDIQIFIKLISQLYNEGLTISLSKIYSDIYSNLIDKNLLMRLSYSQERLWYMEQLMPNHQGFRTTSTFILTGEKEETKEFIQSLIDHHPILRTSIHQDERGFLFHQLHENIHWNLHEDLSLLHLEKKDYPIYSQQWNQQLSFILKSYSTKPFQLDQPPLFRFVYLPIRDDEKEGILHVVCHHLIMDAYSGSVLSKDIYSRINYPNENKSSSLSMTFFQHSLYERYLITTSSYEHKFNYWKNQFERTDYYQIPIDENLMNNEKNSSYPISINEQIISQIKQITSNLGITINSFFASILTIVLSLYADQKESSSISFGMTEAKYYLSNARSIVGCFVNLLVIRSEIKENFSLKEVFVLIHQLILDAIDNSYPFIEMISRLKMKRDQNQNSLFQVLYNYRQLSLLSNTEQFQTIGHDEHRTSQFDLELHINSFDNQQFEIYFLSSSQTNHLAPFIADTYSYLIQQIYQQIHFDQIFIKDLAILSKIQSETFFSMINRNSSTNQFHSDLTDDILDKFNEIVHYYPNEIAIRDQDNQIEITYKELSKYSNDLSAEICQSKSEEENCIGIYLERNVFVPMTILSVLKCGTAYIPLDPQYFPEERLIKVIETTPIKLLITSKDLLKRLKNVLEKQKLKIFICDSILRKNNFIENEFISRKVSKDHTMYIEFTSGSTGIPKGVPISYGNVINQLKSCLKMYQFTKESICIAFHSFAFDLHIWEIFGTFLSGGCLVIVPDARDMNSLFNLCEKNQVTHMSLTPTTFKYFLLIHEKEILNHLKCLMLCGESFDYSLLKDWFKLYCKRDVLIVNAFGITETTVVNSFRSMTIDDIKLNKRYPSMSWIGHPISDNYFIILDEKQEIVPPFVKGELYIGGECVSKEGYLHSSSNEQFLQLKNESCKDIVRWYRTGDLVMYNSIIDDIAYLGRRNQQMKIGGVRIELGEIESVLNHFQEISRSVVVAMSINGNEHLQLIAYLQMKKQIDRKSFLSSIRRELEQLLPSIMIPSKYLFLSSFPLTNNGKIDRVLLSQLETMKKYSNEMLIESNESINEEKKNEEMIICKDHIHHQLMNIFYEIIGHEMSLTSRFFEDEGITSLQSISLINLINSRFDCQLGINILHSYSTVLQLTEYLQNQINLPNTSLVHLIINHSRSKPTEEQISLIFLCPAGGQILQYVHLAQKLSQIYPQINIYGLERIANLNQMDLIHLYVKMLKDNLRKKRIVFIGFRQGGNLLFQLTKNLKNQLDIALILLIDSKLNETNVHYTDAQVLSQLISSIDLISNSNHKDIQQQLANHQSRSSSTNLCQLISNQLNVIPFNNAKTIENYIQTFREDISLCNSMSMKDFHQNIPIGFIASNEKTRSWAEQWTPFVHIDLAVLQCDEQTILSDPLLLHSISNFIGQYLFHRHPSQDKQVILSNSIQSTFSSAPTDQSHIDDQQIQFTQLIKDAHQQIELVKNNIPQLIRVCAMLLHNAFPNTNITHNSLEITDNWDTGNSCAHPFQPFITAIQLASRDVNIYRQYQFSPSVDPHLQNLLLRFCKTIKWLNNDSEEYSPEDDLSVAIGAGTTQLWDCILRTLIVRKNDVVLIPSPSYGLFIPQVEMIGGQILLIPLKQEHQFKLTKNQLHSTILQTHLKLIRKWLKDLPFKLKHLLRTLYDDHFLKEPDCHKNNLIDTQIEEFIQHIEEIILIKSTEDICISTFVEDQLSEFMCDCLLNGNTQLFVQIQSNGLRSTLCPGPPRVVALLHINPSIFGTIYNEKDLTELAQVCVQHKVYIVEDLAYALLQLPIQDRFSASIATFHSIKSVYKTIKSVLLFGLSKPFAIADMRVGFAIGKKAMIDQINVILFTTSCFTPVLFQSSLSTLFPEEHTKITDYLATNAHVYKTKRNLLLACLMGVDKFQYERTIERFELDETKFLLEQITQQKKYDKSMIKAFFSVGLSKYFTVCCVPEAGFFIIVNCQPFLQSIGQQYNIKTSFEAALLLSYFYRVRVVPEEMMGVDLQQTTSPQLLRLSYSISNENIVEAAFTIFSASFQSNTMTAQS